MKKQLFTIFFILLFQITNASLVKSADPIIVYRKKFSLLIYVPNRITYDEDVIAPNETAKYELGKIANGLIENKEIKIEVAVYNDVRFDPIISKEITQKRADAIKNYLVICGANPDNIIAKGYGDTVIINKCKPFVKCTDTEHAVNRRVEFKILNPEKLTNFKMVKK